MTEITVGDTVFYREDTKLKEPLLVLMVADTEVRVYCEDSQSEYPISLEYLIKHEVEGGRLLSPIEARNNPLAFTAMVTNIINEMKTNGVEEPTTYSVPIEQYDMVRELYHNAMELIRSKS